VHDSAVAARKKKNARGERHRYKCTKARWRPMASPVAYKNTTCSKGDEEAWERSAIDGA
jgi:hypothetical protein